MSERCPICRCPGVVVPAATLDALDAVERRHDADRWRFCPTPDCDVVWFGEQTRAVVPRGEVRVRVGAKEDADDRPVCYCFDHPARAIADRAGTDAPISAAIRNRCRQGDDRCMVTNPRGRCCLADVLAVERGGR